MSSDIRRSFLLLSAMLTIENARDPFEGSANASPDYYKVIGNY
ncbi:hypothetical protein J2T12_002272 [Paenibacillus anaericanus]|nr:hypothetical protein [Paenibacillus anaericanus]MDQ0088862.1 hypothetical protein [Paenibacillus anaericanus]